MSEKDDHKKRRTVLVERKHEKAIQNEALNLSKFVRKQIEKEYPMYFIDTKKILEKLKEMGAEDQSIDYKDLVEEIDMDNDKLETGINKLLKQGKIYEPKPGKLKVL